MKTYAGRNSLAREVTEYLQRMASDACLDVQNTIMALESLGYLAGPSPPAAHPKPSAIVRVAASAPGTLDRWHIFEDADSATVFAMSDQRTNLYLVGDQFTWHPREGRP